MSNTHISNMQNSRHRDAAHAVTEELAALRQRLTEQQETDQ